jgi:cell division protein FtsQ
MPVRAPADKRFKRARVQPPRKRRSWHASAFAVAKSLLFIVALAYATSRTVHFLTTAPGLRIDRIAIQGNHQLAARDMATMLRGLRGSNIMQADLDGWRTRLLRSPWIKDAALRRILPSTIELAITEREPLGLGRLNDHLYLVSTDGTIIDEYSSKYAAFDLPIIDGLNAANNDGLLVDVARSTLAADVLKNLHQSSDLAGRISQIDVSSPDDAIVLLADDPARIHLGHEQFAERLRAYLELAPTLRARVPAIDYVDLRFDTRIFVRPIATNARTTTATTRTRFD